MNCYNCGNQLNEDVRMCPKCGAFQSTIKQEKVVPVEAILKESPEEKKKANILCLISVILPFCPTIFVMITSVFNIKNDILTTIFGAIVSVCNLAALVLMIVVRVKYPKNLFGKILMWFYIITIVGGLILTIVFMISCAIMCENFSNLGNMG